MACFFALGRWIRRVCAKERERSFPPRDVNRSREKAFTAQQHVVVFDDHGNARTAIADVGLVHGSPVKKCERRLDAPAARGAGG